MDEGKKDIVTSEIKPMTRGERIASGIGKWVESQMPPAVGERYKKTLTAVAASLTSERPELYARLQKPIEVAAKIAGWADPVVKVALGAAALYGGVSILLDPTGAMAAGAIVDVSKVVGAAVVTAGVNAFKYVVEGVTELGKRVGETWERIINPIDPNAPFDRVDQLPKTDPNMPYDRVDQLPKTIDPLHPFGAEPQIPNPIKFSDI